jgi:hypothetical protein
MRQVLFLTVRQYRKKFGDTPFWHIPAGTPRRFEAVEMHRAWEAAWNDCKSAAIERAAGI